MLGIAMATIAMATLAVSPMPTAFFEIPKELRTEKQSLQKKAMEVGGPLLMRVAQKTRDKLLDEVLSVFIVRGQNNVTGGAVAVTGADGYPTHVFEKWRDHTVLSNV